MNILGTVSSTKHSLGKINHSFEGSHTLLVVAVKYDSSMPTQDTVHYAHLMQIYVCHSPSFQKQPAVFNAINAATFNKDISWNTNRLGSLYLVTLCLRQDQK